MNAKELAEYIGEALNPVRGWRGVKAMLGTTYYSPQKRFDGPTKVKGMGVQFDFKMCRAYNTCQIIYQPVPDCFTLVFFKFVQGGLNNRTFEFEPDQYKNVKVIDTAFVDQLRDVFEQTTKLYLNL